MILSVDLSQPFSLESKFWKSKRPLVLACGCFDLLTVGHVRHLEAARRMGNCLVVLVTPDRYIDKGPARPVFSQEERAEMLDALRCVDLVIVNEHPTAVEAIRCLKPDVYAKGKEYRKVVSIKLKEETTAACKVGCALAFTKTKEAHTTDVLERVLGTKVSYLQAKNEIQQRSVLDPRNCTHKNRVRLDFGGQGKATFCTDCGFEFVGTESF